MVSVDLHAISDLLDKALDLDATAREPWLAELARTEPGLATTLRTLLSRQGELETDELLIQGGRAMGSAVLANAIEGRTGAPAALEFSPQFILQSGTTIGPYRLIRPLGEGGMASVWLAERSDGQLKREVALKLLHAWRNSRELVERFARERDMLAGLAHPNIARLYDAGVTVNGQPWIALEYVEGLDFAAFADQNALSIRQRVESILQVMAAVQYAHQNLIVHRDLKPTNILVNKKGEVRLLDFGIAKLLQQENVSAAETELTRNSGRALTLRYAAPEQIEGKPITTATDVYALGLVLYELLTGASARDGKKPKKKSSRVTNEKTNTQAERKALTTDILRPSRGPIDKKIADARGHVTPAEIKSTLSGDLDTILLKALAREPTRRYPTVSSFAADLNAWLERRPITARAPSSAYAMRMFVSRQRVPVGIAAFAMITLVAAGGYSLEQRADAETHRVRSEEVQTFMANLLTAAEPEGVEDEKALTAKGLLDAGVERARFDYKAKPLMQGEMIAELAPVYMRLGERETGENLLKEAIVLIEQSATADEPSLQIARAHLGGRLLSIGERESAIAMLSSVLKNCRRETTSCQNARGMAHFFLAKDRRLGIDQKLVHAREALLLFEKLPIIGMENRLQALIMSAEFERIKGDFQAAKSMLGQAETHIAQSRAKLSERNSLKMAQIMLAFDKGAYVEAAELADRLLDFFNVTKHHSNKLQLHVYRAHIANYQGLSAPALEQINQVRKIIDPQKPNSTFAYALRYEARALSMAGNHAQASKTIDEAFSVLRKINADQKSEIWLDITRADAEVRARKGDLAHARSELVEMMNILRADDPKNFRDHINTLDMLGAVSLAMGDAIFAITCHSEEINLLEAHFAVDHPLRLRAEMQALLAKMQIEPNESHKKLLAKIVIQLKGYFPAESVHKTALSKLVASEGSESSVANTQKQLVLIF
jgi:eukaryotic-like serine/threonine-protein kinase